MIGFLWTLIVLGLIVMSEAPTLDYLVLDSGAIIKGHGLNLFKNAKVIVTVPEVFAELRDSKARDLLARLPYTIEERMPSAESIKAVTEFATKTGDFAALSKTDLRLIALTHMLELEIYGSIAENNYKSLKSNLNLRTPAAKPAVVAPKAPIQTSSQLPVTETAAPEPSLEPANHVEVADTEVVIASESEGEESESEDEEAEAVESIAQDVSEMKVSEEAAPAEETSTEATAKPSVFSWASIASKAPSAAPKPVVKPTTVVHAAIVSEPTPRSPVVDASSADGFTQVVSASSNSHRTTSNIVSRQSGLGSGTAESQRMAGEDDGLGWINSSNLAVHLSSGGGQFGMLSTETAEATAAAAAAAAPEGGAKKKSKKKKPKQRPVKVACVTTDFSMQNVMMQIGLNIMSVDGLIIKSVKQWVLRCMACYHIHYDMDRLFCYRCGTNHLSRVSASIDQETGVLKLHLKKNYHTDTRGTKYSLPAPGKQDRYEGELLLREDQLLSGQ